MDQPLDERYFEWLYRQVASVRQKNPARTYWSLAKQLFTKEFVWLVPNDDNRVEDGRDLRYEFLNEVHGLEKHHVDPEWVGIGCSMFEMMIGLSRRLAFEDEGEPAGWFWLLCENLDIRKFNDKKYGEDEVYHAGLVDETLDAVIWRTYEFDGRGGLFPLEEAAEDQRDVEIWYQLSAYLLERT